MAFCADCGAATRSGEPCPACGAFAHEAAGLSLDIDRDALSRQHEAGVSAATASAAQMGGGQVHDLMPERPARKPHVELHYERPRQSASWDEREAQNRRDLWLAARIPVLAILGWFTLSHLVLDAKWVFIDNVGILLHEGGHVIWGWAGDTIAALGGTLGQLMFPGIFAAYFYFKRQDRFAAVACLWWFGENLLPISTYMADAAEQRLPLIGGTVHDWGYLFGKWGLIPKHDEIAATVRWLGTGTMLVCLGLLVYWTLKPTQNELASQLEMKE